MFLVNSNGHFDKQLNYERRDIVAPFFCTTETDVCILARELRLIGDQLILRAGDSATGFAGVTTSPFGGSRERFSTLSPGRARHNQSF